MYDDTWIAIITYIDTMPIATASGSKSLAPGTNRSATPKLIQLSITRPNRCSPVITSAVPPSHLCRSSSQAGRS